MGELAWTVALVAVSCTALWVAATHWQGWVVGVMSELLWFGYAVTIRAVSLMIMAVIWGLVNARNAVVAYQRRNQ